MKTYVFISSAGTRSFLSSRAPYSKMKVGVEDAIKELGFEHAIILRPGMILGREVAKAAFFESIVGNLNKLGQGLQDRIGMRQLCLDNCGHVNVLDGEVLMFKCRSRPNDYWKSCCGSCPNC